VVVVDRPMSDRGREGRERGTRGEEKSTTKRGSKQKRDCKVKKRGKIIGNRE